MPARPLICCGFQRWRGVVVIFGGILIHLSLGTLYTFGNLSPYLTSFMRKHGSAPDLTYTDAAWVFALAAMGQGASMFLGGLIERKIGPVLTCLLGGWCMSAGVFLTYFSIKQSFPLAVLTYGAVFGFGVGIAYAIPLGCCIRWFPERKGLVSGFVVAGFGGGAFIFDRVQTSFINPENEKPNQVVDDEVYFTQSSILDSVPDVFLLMGGCYAGMQLIGSLLICNPPSSDTMDFDMDVLDDKQKTDDGPSTMEEERERAAILGTGSQVSLAQNGEKASIVNRELTSSNTDDNEVDVPPKQILKSRDFYVLWFIFFFNGQGSVLVSTLYKAYGLTFIRDDSFMSTVGSFAALFNAGGRIMWGLIADRWSFRVASMLMCAAFTCLMLTFQVSSHGGKAVYFIYVCLLFGSFCGSFALFPTATAKCFGRKHLPLNYGLLFTSQVLTTPLGVTLSQRLKGPLGWNGLFFISAGFSFASLVLSVLFRGKDKNGKEI